MKKNQSTTENVQPARSYRRVTVTINDQTYHNALKQAEQEGKPLSQIIAGIIEQKLMSDVPGRRESKRLTISLPDHTHSELLKRKDENMSSLSSLVSSMLDSAFFTSQDSSA